MTAPPQATAFLVKALLVGGSLMVLAGSYVLASGAARPIVGAVVLAAGLLDLGLAAVLAKRS